MSKELKALICSIKMLCAENSNILTRTGKSEGACQFRIAKYLSEILERDDLFIDCEFNKSQNNPKKIRLDKDHKIRPDIIYHDRNTNNICVIEIKIGSPKHNKLPFKDDRRKVHIIMKQHGYKHGYCVSNIKINTFTIHIIKRNNNITKKIIFSNQSGAWGMKIERDQF